MSIFYFSYTLYLSKSCSKIIDNIQQVYTKERVITEIDMYSVEESLAGIDVNLPCVDFLNEVQNVMEGDYPKYEILSKFTLAMGTFFNSNSEVERVFSVWTEIHCNPKKNKVSQEIFYIHIRIRYGVEL